MGHLYLDSKEFRFGLLIMNTYWFIFVNKIPNASIVASNEGRDRIDHTREITAFSFNKNWKELKTRAGYKGGSRHKNWCMARVLSFLIRYFSNYYTLLRSDLAARVAPLDLRLGYRNYIGVDLGSLSKVTPEWLVFLS